jgi:hypothetical protein
MSEKKSHKYGAIAVEIDGHRFPSKREAKRYGELKMLIRAGAIRGLELQPSFDLHVAGERVCRYVADFRYWDVGLGRLVVEDCKGVSTPVFKLKKKMVAAEYAIEVKEV